MAGKNDEYVFRHLPGSYRRAGTEGPAYALTHMLGRTLVDLERVSLQVMKSRFLEHLNDMDDAERLAALYELTPWPEEDLEAFRSRVRLMARIYLQGAAAAEGMLEVLGAAFDLELAELQLPFADGNDRYTTTGKFRKRNSDQVSFTAKVVDTPLTVKQEKVTGPEFKWTIDSNLYAEPPIMLPNGTYIEGQAPDPIVDIAAGEHPVVLPVLVQQDTRRFVLINRIIPPGAILRVDLKHHRVFDLDGPVTLLGPVVYGDGTRPELLYGTGGMADTDAGRLSGPSAKPFHILHWSDAIRREAGMPEVPGPPGTFDPVPGGNLPWPPMVALGATRWRLMRGANPDGGTPVPEIPLPHASMRVLPLTENAKPDYVNFQWRGRRLGTFTIKYSARKLGRASDSDSDSGSAPDSAPESAPAPVAPEQLEQEQKRLEAWVKRRQEWLGQQIDRLKLAGVQYVELCENPPHISKPNSDRAPVLALTDMTMVGDSLAWTIERDDPHAAISETLVIADKVQASVSKPTALSEHLQLLDEVMAEVTPGDPGPVEAAAELSEQLQLLDDVKAEVTPGDIGPVEAAAELSEHLQLLDELKAEVTPGDPSPVEILLALNEHLLPKAAVDWLVVLALDEREVIRGVALTETLVPSDRLQVEIRSQ